MNSPKLNDDWIDGSLYPDEPVPEKIETLAEKVDFLVRMCAAWDFGLPPSSDSLKEVLQDDWKQAVDEARFLNLLFVSLTARTSSFETSAVLGAFVSQYLERSVFG